MYVKTRLVFNVVFPMQLCELKSTQYIATDNISNVISTENSEEEG